MPPSTLLQSLLGSLLDSPTVVEIATPGGAKALSLIREHFTYTALEISKAYQDSYGLAMGAIYVGLAAPDKTLSFADKIFQSKITGEFAAQIDHHYLKPFAAKRGVNSEALSTLRKQLVDNIKHLSERTEQFQFEVTEEDLAALINYQGTIAITDLVIEQIAPLDDTVADFLRYEGLLGNALVFFFRECIRQDERLETTQDMLQREGLCVAVSDIQSELKAIEGRILEAVKNKTPILELAQRQHQLVQIETAWQTRNKQLIQFNRRFENQLGELLTWAKKTIEAAYDTKKKEAAEQFFDASASKNAFPRRSVGTSEKRRQPEKEQAEQAKRQAEAEQLEKAQQEETQYGKLFKFELVTLNSDGKITHREQKQARCQNEDLGKGVTLEMVSIPGGTFMMGSPETEEGGYDNEKPQHKVTVPTFFMGKYPVTQAQWQAVMGNNPSSFKGENRPVETVSWNDAVKFCQQLSEKTGKEYRLPSETEWEYACRAGTTTPFYFGETITADLVNYNANCPYASGSKGVYRKQTTDVGSFPPNAFGLYDMHGNVREWCADLWHNNYKGAPSDGSIWGQEKKGVLAEWFSNDNADHLSFRGGSWGSGAWRIRSAFRGIGWPTSRNVGLGLRVARL